MTRAQIENTIIVGDYNIDCNRRIVESLIGRNTQISDSANNLPRGSLSIIGENSLVYVQTIWFETVAYLIIETLKNTTCTHKYDIRWTEELCLRRKL